MLGNDLSNRPAKVIGIRLDNFLVKEEEKNLSDNMLYRFLSKIRITSPQYFLSTEVLDFVAYVFKHTDFTVRYVFIQDSDPKILEYIGEYFAMPIDKVFHISSVDYMLRYGDLTYFVDSEEEVEKIGNKYALSLQQANNIFRGRL